MRLKLSKSLAMFSAVFALGIGLTALAREGHKHGAPLHGGKVTMTDEYHMEVVFAKDGVKVYPRTHEDKPLNASTLTGTAKFYRANSTKPWFERKLSASPKKVGQTVSFIGAAVDLSKVPAGDATVEFKIAGLPEATEKTVTFSVPFALASTGAIVVTKATKDDAKAIAAMKTCPVSKEALDSMGAPLKVSRDDKSIFICCNACLKKIKADPDKYFSARTAVPAAKDE